MRFAVFPRVLAAQGRAGLGIDAEGDNLHRVSEGEAFEPCLTEPIARHAEIKPWPSATG